MKKALAVLGETVLMLIVAFAVMLRRPFGVTIVLARMETSTRQFDVDWVISVLIIAALIAIIGAVMKRFRAVAGPLAIALAITLLIGFAMKFGFRTTDLRAY